MASLRAVTCVALASARPCLEQDTWLAPARACSCSNSAGSPAHSSRCGSARSLSLPAPWRGPARPAADTQPRFRNESTSGQGNSQETRLPYDAIALVHLGAANRRGRAQTAGQQQRGKAWGSVPSRVQLSPGSRCPAAGAPTGRSQSVFWSPSPVFLRARGSRGLRSPFGLQASRGAALVCHVTQPRALARPPVARRLSGYTALVRASPCSVSAAKQASPA